MIINSIDDDGSTSNTNWVCSAWATQGGHDSSGRLWQSSTAWQSHGQAGCSQGVCCWWFPLVATGTEGYLRCSPSQHSATPQWTRQQWRWALLQRLMIFLLVRLQLFCATFGSDQLVEIKSNVYWSSDNSLWFEVVSMVSFWWCAWWHTSINWVIECWCFDFCSTMLPLQTEERIACLSWYRCAVSHSRDYDMRRVMSQPNS